MMLDFEPGDKVINPLNKEWGIGQVQSIIKDKVTVNFENAGKKVILKKLTVLLLAFMMVLLILQLAKEKELKLQIKNRFML